MKINISSLRVVIGLLLASLSAFAQNVPIRIEVDATDAPRKILHANLHIPARPGELTLVYPKWIPGEHGPTGPITDVAGVKIKAGGQTVAWRRDDEDMYAFHLNLPAGADGIDVSLDFLLPPNTAGFSGGGSATAKLLDLNWNQVLLYPKGSAVSEINFAATLRLPEGWKFGTALPVTTQSADRIEFRPVSLETLVDSPVIAGTHFRTVELGSGNAPSLSPPRGEGQGEGSARPHYLHIVADSAAALEIKPDDARHFSQLVAETGALFGGRHYRQYHFLLTLSDYVAHFGLEHHESSDNRQGERYLIDEEPRKVMALLLPHETTHSWNGKYRRPVGLATPDFQQPMRGELLWVYEGLTDYLGLVLATRCGLWTNQNFHEWLALEAAALDREPGRTWRPLSDTAIAAQLLYEARPESASWRRSVDFYQEGDLIWLEADVIIREKTQGRKSLDDFCKKFHGGTAPPKVMPYTAEEVYSTLNEITPHDWKEFFNSRVYATTRHAPLGGIEGSGWRLAYTNSVPDMLKSLESVKKFTDMRFSLGLTIKEDGTIIDVLPGSPADKAGIGPATKLLAVNGRRWTPPILRTAVKAGRGTTAPIDLLVENSEFIQTHKLDYHNGEQYPILVRDSTKPDLLTEILKPLTRAPTASP